MGAYARKKHLSLERDVISNILIMAYHLPQVAVIVASHLLESMKGTLHTSV